jgi:hypothetical protein
MASDAIRWTKHVLIIGDKPRSIFKLNKIAAITHNVNTQVLSTHINGQVIQTENISNFVDNFVRDLKKQNAETSFKYFQIGDIYMWYNLKLFTHAYIEQREDLSCMVYTHFINGNVSIDGLSLDNATSIIEFMID